MKSFFEDGVYEEITSRIDKLSSTTQPKWGKMNVGQMLHHCQMPLNIILEKENYGVKSNWLINLLFKKSMYSDKLWRKNMPTAPGFRITDQKEFDSEKQAIVKLIVELHELIGNLILHLENYQKNSGEKCSINTWITT